MELGFVGLGRMGLNMVQRLVQAGHRVAVSDRAAAAVEQAAGRGAVPAGSVGEMMAHLRPPRAVWIMVPAGDPIDAVLADLAPHLDQGDIVVDGGNSRYTDSVRRSQELAGRGVSLVDVGTSGGVWGLTEGFCLMAGGEKAACDRLEPVFAALAPTDGYLYAGPSGAGHYAKMIHNGIEYGMLQAYGEGFAILEAAPYPFDLAALAHLWNHGSVIRSWLLQLAEGALGREPDLASVRAWVEDSGEGRWTVQEALERNVPAPVLNLALLMRLRSRQPDSFSDKLIAALRGEFGGHAVQRGGKGS